MNVEIECHEPGLNAAEDAARLESRIHSNTKHQTIDMVSWIFQDLQIPAGSSVLELCSGTGAQTRKLLELVGSCGRVVALDSSAKALAKLKDRIPSAHHGRLMTVVAPMEELDTALSGCGLERGGFALCFCAYGLYYSRQARETLLATTQWIRRDGRIVIVGPFGPNNTPLFRFLELQGVTIPAYIRFTSETFMTQEVIPFASQVFEHLQIRTLVNRVCWRAPREILAYWMNSTFYDDTRRHHVESALRAYFAKHEQFVNEKWIMMVEMHKRRSSRETQK